MKRSKMISKIEYLLSSCHPIERGDKQVAEEILNFIESEGFELPPNRYDATFDTWYFEWDSE